MGNLPSTGFPVHPATYSPPNHNAGMGVNQIFSAHHVGALGEIGAGWLVCTCSRCSRPKGGISYQTPSNSRNACFRITYRLRLT